MNIIRYRIRLKNINSIKYQGGAEMSIEAQKEKIHKMIEEIMDEKILRKIYTFIKYICKP